MATHEMAFASPEVADTVCFLDGGRIVESGSAPNRFDRSASTIGLKQFLAGGFH